MALYARKAQVAIALETLSGTAETLTAADAIIMAHDVNYSPPDEQHERPIVLGDLDTSQSIPGKRLASLSFKVEIKGSGTIDTAPAIGLILQTGGQKETIVASTSVAYTFDSDDADSYTGTVGVNLGGHYYEMYGARGDWTFNFAANGICIIDVTYTGIHNDDADQALWSPTYESTIPPIWKAASFVLNFGSPWSGAKLASCSIGAGNNVVASDNANASNGLQYAEISNRNVTGTVDMEQVLVADQDMMSHMLTPTLASMSFVLGSATGNTLTVTAPKLQITSLPHATRDEKYTWNMGFALRRNSGDDSLVFTFT